MPQGTFLGALALLLFAFVIYRLLPSQAPFLTLAVASLAWLALSALLWFLAKRR